MIAHVLLNLLNELGTIDNMRGLPRISSLFRNEFDTFNITGARMSDSFYHTTLKLHENRIIDVKTSRLCHLLRSVKMVVIT